MRAIIDIALAVIFSFILGTGSVNLISKAIKKEAIIKVYGGLGSLESFTKKMTSD